MNIKKLSLTLATIITLTTTLNANIFDDGRDVIDTIVTDTAEYTPVLGRLDRELSYISFGVESTTFDVTDLYVNDCAFINQTYVDLMEVNHDENNTWDTLIELQAMVSVFNKGCVDSRD